MSLNVLRESVKRKRRGEKRESKDCLLWLHLGQPRGGNV